MEVDETFLQSCHTPSSAPSLGWPHPDHPWTCIMQKPQVPEQKLHHSQMTDKLVQNAGASAGEGARFVHLCVTCPSC